MPIKVWGPITYPFPVLNGRTRWSLVIDIIYKNLQKSFVYDSGYWLSSTNVIYGK